MAVRVDLNISLDGFATTTDQTPENPFGPDWARLTEAYTATRTFRARVLQETSGEGTTGVDDRYAQAYFAEVGAEIMGAGMFGLHANGDDPDWRGWWGDEPPFHCPVFVLTHSPRPVLEMAGGTTFHFLVRDAARGARCRVDGCGRQGRADRRRPDGGPRVPQVRTRRPAPRRYRPDPARSRNPALGRPPRTRGRLRRDVGRRPERDHAPDLLALKVRVSFARREPFRDSARHTIESATRSRVRTEGSSWTSESSSSVRCGAITTPSPCSRAGRSRGWTRQPA